VCVCVGGGGGRGIEGEWGGFWRKASFCDWFGGLMFLLKPPPFNPPLRIKLALV
jgi:hypothetical protein